MNNFDLKPLLRSTVGFDNLATLLDTLMSRSDLEDSYPPYNIEKLEGESYRIEIAVAGFTKEDITVTAHQNRLIIAGRKASTKKDRNFLYKGIAERSFEHAFNLADFVHVEDVLLEDGLLKINLKREIPEDLKPRSIQIKSAPQAQKTIEQKIIDQK
ncbi:MAG: Hsp20 family protein [Alphaproteobacteria bacterium]|nr:Hsp20 family protein [Alphaproteobacteria bacterium]